jgi:adenine-specific DNA-methyltransferase
VNNGKTKLELTWVGKEERPRLEPRILVEDHKLSYGDPRTENLLIEGDNLLALKALEQDFTGQVKCIFIDPPYNTGSAFKHYDDGLEHSIWLSMMRDRLEVLRRLLAQNGSLWITIDDNECHYLKVLCDEVFGRFNFVANVVWQKKASPQPNAIWLSDSHDHVLVYANNKAIWRPNLLHRTAEANARYANPDNDPRGPWTSGDCTISLTGGQRGAQYARTGHSENLYDIETPSGRKVTPPPGTCWRFSEPRFKELIADKQIWFGKSGNNVPRYKRFLSEVQEGIVCMTVWPRTEVGDNQEAKREVMEFNSDEVFATPKPERLMNRIVALSTEPGDLVFDSFAGSGTTGAVAHKMGRRWIMVEIGNHCRTHIIPRLTKVVDGTDQGGITEAVEWKGGGGFKFYRLAETLLVRDGDLSTYSKAVYVINPKYDAAMLIRAICKIENYRYPKNHRWHGVSSEHHFLYVTTKLFDQKQLNALSKELSEDDALLVYCTRKVSALKVPDNIEIKKIPRDLLAKCTFEEGRV